MKKLLALCAAICLTATVYAGEFQDITIKELKSEMAAKKVTLLDANGTESWESGHIPGAVNFEATESKLSGVLPKDKSALHRSLLRQSEMHGIPGRSQSREETWLQQYQAPFRWHCRLEGCGRKDREGRKGHVISIFAISQGGPFRPPFFMFRDD